MSKICQVFYCALGCLFILVLSAENVSAKRLCDQFDWMTCPESFQGGRSQSVSAAPSSSAVSSLNPAGINTRKRLGIETIRYKHWYDVNLVVGTGVVGSAFTTANGSGTFFGNVAEEEIETYESRVIARRKYKSPKYNLVLASSVIGKGDFKKFNLNIGTITQYNQETSQLRGGFALNAFYRNFSLGASRVKNDYLNTTTDLIEDYYTDTLNVAFKVANVAVDWSYILNHRAAKSRVRILTGSVFFKKAMLTVGFRQEESETNPYLYGENNLFDRTTTTKDESFTGFQYLVTKEMILSLFYNYYLLDEYSLAFTFFI